MARLAVRPPAGLVVRAVAVLACTLGLGGCECGGSSGETGSGEGELAPELRVGFVEGVVRLADGEELPSYPQNPLVIPGRSAVPDSCTPAREEDRTPVRVAEESGGLTNLSIVATGTEEEGWPRAGEPVLHEVVIRDCRIEPATLVTTRGDRIRISNDTAYPFFPEIGEGILQALLRGEPREITLDRGGVRTIQCGFAAPCGRMELITLYHPVHTVSQADGRFRLEVPAGRGVRVTAWHPLFREASVTVQVEPGETRQVELRVEPSSLGRVQVPQDDHVRASDLDPDPNVPY